MNDVSNAMLDSNCDNGIDIVGWGNVLNCFYLNQVIMCTKCRQHEGKDHVISHKLFSTQGNLHGLSD